jgi:hypothetical protein
MTSKASTPKHPVTPAPTLPAHELLGDMLLEQTQPAEALAAYKRSIEFYPRRFNSLLGAARAAHALGDQSQAHIFYQELLEVADGGTRQPALKRQTIMWLSRRDRGTRPASLPRAAQQGASSDRRRSVEFG